MSWPEVQVMPPASRLKSALGPLTVSVPERP